ncbi:uncharacterized protein LOC144097149 [Amblyomma americanum]
MLPRSTDAQAKGEPSADVDESPQGPDQREEEPKPAAAEPEALHKPASLTPRVKLKWRTLRAAGNPMKPVCLALMVLCTLLLLAVLGHMLFAGARHHGPRGEQEAGLNITADQPATTTESLLHARSTTAATTETTAATSTNNADATSNNMEDATAGRASTTGGHVVAAVDSILD